MCAYKILAFLPVPSESHYYIGHNLMKALAAEGHEVTVISPFKEKKPIGNYTEVFLEIFLRRVTQKKYFLIFKKNSI